MLENGFEWIVFYKSISKEIINYKDNRAKLANIINETFIELDIPIFKVCADNQDFDDIDPFSFFAFFNRSFSKREEFARIIGRKLNITNIPEHLNFNGIPVVNPLSSMFYNYDDSRTEQINIIWNLFETTYDHVYKNDSLANDFAEQFDKAVNIKFNGINKITIALSWCFLEVLLI